ncbi:MAG: P-loop NTPase [Theionarchaea archaeon]|nr:P-loop NTPase [Theionarchaea archaeon]
MRDMYNPRVITIASGKGGTGKTTATANLGTSLALLGKKTIILDADIAMANLALILGMEKSKVTLHEVLAGEADIKDSMYKGPGGVIVVPCGVSLSGFQKSNPERLQDVMIELLKGTEFLLIDAPAGLSRDGVIPLAVADEVILVVNPEISSMADALKTKIMTEMVGSRVSGAILNRANFEKTDLSMREVEKILGVKILEVIPEDPEVRRSTAFKTPIVIRSEDSPASVAYRRLASKMVGERFVEPEAEREEGVVGRFVRSIFGE